MKLSKKIVAAILTVAMVITQVSVFSFASGNYASGKNDDAYFALEVPNQEYVAYGELKGGVGSWVQASKSIGKTDKNTYASNIQGNVYITTVNGERFFEIATSSALAANDNVIFRNAPANTYTSEGTPLFNGLPSSINPNTLTGMMFRFKGQGSATDTINIDITTTNKSGITLDYVAKEGIKLIEFATGKVTDVTYNNGIKFAGDFDGYVYVPFTGLINGTSKKLSDNVAAFAANATAYATSNTGYKGFQVKFKDNAFRGKTLLIGNAYFTKSYDTIEEIHTSPAAPTLFSATETSISVNAVSGIQYSIDKNDWNTTGEFTGLTEGTVYTVYARYSEKSTRFASVQFATLGLSAPVLKEAGYDSLKVNVVAGQEYSLDQDTWNTTGEFTGLAAGTEYTIYTRLAGDSSEIKSSKFSTLTYPWASGYGDGAYEALTIGSYTNIPSTHVTVSGGVGNSGALAVTEIEGEKYITLTSAEGVEGSAAINAALITYAKSFGLPDDMFEKNSFKGLALRIKIVGNDDRTLTGFDVAIGEYAAIDGDYIFIDAKTGAQKILTRDLGFTATEDLDGWLMLPFEYLRKPIENSVPVQITPTNLGIYQTVVVTLHGTDCVDGVRSDWTDISMNIGDSLFYTDATKFVTTHAVPTVVVKSKTKNSIAIDGEDGVEYSINGTTWQTAELFANLQVGTEYTISARYIGKTAVGTLKVKTRFNNVDLKAPVFDYATTDSLVLKYQDDHEYSVDGGETWVESNIISGLEDGREYEVYSRVVGKEEMSSVVLMSTIGSPYSTDNKDSANYFFRVPNKTETGAALPEASGKAYLSSTVLNTTIESAFGTTLNVETIDGERFVELKKTGTADAFFKISSNAYYNGKQYFGGKAGIPDAIDYASITGIAIRVATKGGVEGTVTNIDFKLKRNDQANIFPQQATEFQYIDIETKELKTLSRDTSFKIDGDINGWIILPISSYWKNVEETVNDLKNYFEGVVLSVGGDWSGKTLYVGDSVFVYDITNFIYANSAPSVPELIVKSDTMITVNTVTGFEYSIDNGANWQTGGEFTGLTENTEYEILARRVGRTIVSKAVLKTDYTNPPLTVPELISKGYHELTVKVIPGVEYSIDGENWNETGVFTDLNPGTKYNVIGRNKNTHEETPALEVVTEKYDNPYDRGDGSSDYMPISRYGDKYNEYWFSENMGLNANGEGKVPTEGGYLDVVEIDGERFINFKVHTLDGLNPNFCLKCHNTYGQEPKTGFPNAIWVKNFWGFAIRMKLCDNGTNPGFHFYFNFGTTQINLLANTTYYLIDNKTGQWTKKNIPANNRVHLGEFDGWLMVPFTEFINRGMSWEDLQYRWDSLQPFQRSGVNYANGDWEGVDWYIGDTVVVEDINTFTGVYAPNSSAKIENQPHNHTTDANFPGIMVNDCEGAELGNGLYGIEGVRASVADIVKPHETTPGLVLDPGSGTSTIYIKNDALNFEEITQDVRWQVLDSVGLSFYVRIPESFGEKVGFGIESREGTEAFYYGGGYYYTVSDGKATKNYGPIELKAGFEGYVLVPFDTFAYDSINSSEMVDGSFFSPDIVDYFGFSFDIVEYPALNKGSILVDDLYMYQSVEQVVTYLLKLQGTDEYSIFDNVKTYRQDDYPEFPRQMANDCSGIEVGKGIYSMTNVTVSLGESKDSDNAFAKVEIGNGISNIMFENHAFWDDMTEEERETIMSSEGISFWVSVPEDAPMIVGLDFEICEDESEYFLYDPNNYYYTVRDGQVYQVYGYLEFEPGFEGNVIIPFDSLYFDESYSDYWDGELYDLDLISYFGFYFNTDDYVSIGETEISIDDIAFYQNAYEYIDAIWAKQTGNGATYVPPSKKPASTSPNTGDSAMPIVAVAGLAIVSTGLLVFTRKRRTFEK